jgi:hypothetical protein
VFYNRDKQNTKAHPVTSLMTEYISEYYPLFGVKTFHDQGIYGKILTGPLTNTKIKLFIIDTGFDDADGDADPFTEGIQENIDISNVQVINYSNSSVSPKAPSHGSLTAALVAAPINQFGIVGVCPDADIYLGDVDNSDGTILQTNVVSALGGAIAMGVDIISIALGSKSFIPALETAINAAVSAGIYVFASAGNSSRTRYEYPASFPGVISVGSINIEGELSSFNTRNERVAIFAPGERYLLPSNVGPVFVSGSSFSCPYAAGLWALQLAKERAVNPSYKPTREETITILRSEGYLNNGTLGYAALADPNVTSPETIRIALLAFGGFVVFCIVAILYITFKENLKKRKLKQRMRKNMQRMKKMEYARLQAMALEE